MGQQASEPSADVIARIVQREDVTDALAGHCAKTHYDAESVRACKYCTQLLDVLTVAIQAALASSGAPRGTYVHECGLAVPHTADQCWDKMAIELADARRKIVALEADLKFWRDYRWGDKLPEQASGAPPQKEQEKDSRVVGFPEMEHGDLPQPPTK